MKQSIGTATIIMNSRGFVTDAKFVPNMELNACEKLVSELRVSDASTLEKAQLVFSAWFNKMNSIEMAEDSKIVVEDKGTKGADDHKVARIFEFSLESTVVEA